MKMNQK